MYSICRFSDFCVGMLVSCENRLINFLLTRPHSWTLPCFLQHTCYPLISTGLPVSSDLLRTDNKRNAGRYNLDISSHSSNLVRSHSLRIHNAPLNCQDRRKIAKIGESRMEKTGQTGTLCTFSSHRARIRE